MAPSIDLTYSLRHGATKLTNIVIVDTVDPTVTFRVANDDTITAANLEVSVDAKVVVERLRVADRAHPVKKTNKGYK